MKTVAFVVVVGLGSVLAADPAAASLWTLDLSGTVADGISSTFTVGTTTYQVYSLDLGLGGASPFLLSQGDEIQATVTLDTPLALPSGSDQFVGINFINTSGADPGTELNTNTVYGYYTFDGGPQYSANCGNCLSSIYYQPGSPVTSFTTVYTDVTIGQLATPYTINDVTLSYQVSGPTSAVPEPSTWAMMLVGFTAVGFAGYRQTKRRRAASFWAA